MSDLQTFQQKLSSESSANIVRFVLGDQLNASHSWYETVRPDVVYVIAELHEETTYVKHHIQKVVTFFQAMTLFAQRLQMAGHRVLHFTLDDTAGMSTAQVIEGITQATHATQFEYQRPDEYRVLQQFRMLDLPSIDILEFDTEHFLLPFDDIPKQAKLNKSVRMEAFYRRMRKRFGILMNNGEPEGERWNFDANNRKSYKPNDLNAIPKPRLFERDDDAILERIQRHKVSVFGELHAARLWPVTEQEARNLLSDFCEHGLPQFGTFQDAMTMDAEHGWLGFHSRLSFAMNAKILHPMQVINAAIQAYRQREYIDIAQVEGFVRQILGWREFVRVLYWVNMPTYEQMNFFNADRALPSWYWTGETHMQCMRQAISQSLSHAYAHHIQRLMVTGNFALLAGLSPDEVDDWYLGIYIDALQWVELPNTRGMVLFADGGWLASKPYAASGQYIHRMSDYCKSCRYDVKQKTGANACPVNSLYWHFLARNAPSLMSNNRLALAYKNWARYSQDEQQAILDHAETVLINIEQL